jgi:hypothetical protein
MGHAGRGGGIGISSPAQRLRAVAALAAHLERVLGAERRHRAAMPYTPRTSAEFCESERRVAALEDAICILREISF